MKECWGTSWIWGWWPTRMHDAELEIVPLRKEPLVLACHPQHPFAKLRSVKLKALNGQKFISFEPDMPTRKALDKILKGQGVTVQHVMEFDNIETVKRAVELNCGVAIVPEATIKQEVAQQTLAAVPLEGNYFRTLGAVYRSNKVLSLALKQFLALLKEIPLTGGSAGSGWARVLRGASTGAGLRRLLAYALGCALAVVDPELIEPLKLGRQPPGEILPVARGPRRPGDLGQRAQPREHHVLRVLEVGDILRP